MENYSRYKLEHAFAADFNSPLFPVLANLYYEKKEYKRALKVCTIGSISLNPSGNTISNPQPPVSDTEFVVEPPPPEQSAK